jgi:hypothetical protein
VPRRGGPVTFRPPPAPPSQPAGRGKGWQYDTHPRAPGFRAFMAATKGAPAPRDMVPLVDHLRDQTITSCCVGFAFARALDIRAKLEGVPNPYPSAQAIYTIARLKSGSRVLIDQGCMPADAAEGLQEYGIVDEKRYPFAEAHINDAVPWDVIQNGADCKVAGCYRIDAFGQQRIDQVRAVLEQGYPVAFGMSVDQAFEDWRGGAAYNEPRGRSLGGHMQCLIYEPGMAERGEFRLVGSWSHWGEGPGLARITEGFLGSSFCTDFYTVTLAPPGVC